MKSGGIGLRALNTLTCTAAAFSSFFFFCQIDRSVLPSSFCLPHAHVDCSEMKKNSHTHWGHWLSYVRGEHHHPWTYVYRSYHEHLLENHRNIHSCVDEKQTKKLSHNTNKQCYRIFVLLNLVTLFRTFENGPRRLTTLWMCRGICILKGKGFWNMWCDLCTKCWRQDWSWQTDIQKSKGGLRQGYLLWAVLCTTEELVCPLCTTRSHGRQIIWDWIRSWWRRGRAGAWLQDWECVGRHWGATWRN